MMTQENKESIDVKSDVKPWNMFHILPINASVEHILYVSHCTGIHYTEDQH
jgi:hypothetical protein